MKLLPRILFEKHVYVLALELAKPRNNHCANCIGTLFRSLCTGRWRWFTFWALRFSRRWLLVDAREVRDDDGHRQRYDEHAPQWTDAADELAAIVTVPAPAHTQCWLCVGWCRYDDMVPDALYFQTRCYFWHGYSLLATHFMSESTCI